MGDSAATHLGIHQQKTYYYYEAVSNLKALTFTNWTALSALSDLNNYTAVNELQIWLADGCV